MEDVDRAGLLSHSHQLWPRSVFPRQLRIRSYFYISQVYFTLLEENEELRVVLFGLLVSKQTKK